MAEMTRALKAQVKGWKVYYGTAATRPKVPGEILWKSASTLYVVKEAAEQFCDLAIRNGKLAEVRAVYCYEREHRA